MELLYADDLVLISETKELLLEEVRNWKKGMEKKGLRLRVNARKTKILWCRLSKSQAEDMGEHPCGVCRKGVGSGGATPGHARSNDLVKKQMTWPLTWPLTWP